MRHSGHKVVLEEVEIVITVREVDNTMEYYVESDSERFLEIFDEKGIFLTKDDPGKDAHIIELVKPAHQQDATEILKAARSMM